MSGGEKSLVALAFLFAVFLARPCPFYILDEVEAALDDANIDRFLQLLRRYCDRAQFIVVTHQKRTMDAADCLYGVSMGGDGISKVVSRKLPPRDDGDLDGEPRTRRFEPTPDAAAEETSWLQGVRVLVVEDNATNRLIATKMLESMGASVETAEDGEQGVAAARRSAFDLIFMDIQMPVMDGIEATRAIRALPGEVSHTPIVATTANAMAHQIEAYRAAGMNGSIAKPISPAALLTELARIVGNDTEDTASAVA